MTPSQSDPRSPAGAGSAATIRLSVNGEPYSLAASSTVAALLDALGMGDRRVAVALNRRVVGRAARSEVELAEGDRVEILEAVGGG